MDTQKAIRELQSRIDLIDKDYKNDVPEYREALVTAVLALEKQVARKPDYIGVGIPEENGYASYCPRCDCNLDDNREADYCPGCGQKLEW